ncbi:MAG: hypothetical protein KGH87_06590 [Thaumarchaeota archaeon]|nr:hypothetical protein [Nitrososphaerota archaeon]
MKENGDKPERLGYPTVLCFDETGLRGFMGTQRRKDALVAGPLVLGKRRSLSLAFKLLNAYENLLITLEQKEYLFTVLPTNDLWKSLVEKFITRYGGIEKLHVHEDGITWYRRNLA